MAGRERGAARVQAPPRKNEYFIPKDGIDREVITADICRYLGNDALVRPGNYEDKATGVVQQGYFINAYRNLTSAMITDLKLDSERWGEERRQTASRGQPQNVEYRTSTTHQSRQHYGPSTDQPPVGIPAGYGPSHAAPQGYGQQSAPPSAQQQVVYSSPQYQGSPYAQSAPGPYAAAPPPQQYAPQDSYYLTNTNLRVDHQQGPDRAIHQPRTLPAGGGQYQPAPTYQQQQPDPRSYYAQPAPSPASSAQTYQQSPDPYYSSRAPPPVGGPYGNSTPEVYDGRYQDGGAYSQPPLSSGSSATVSSSGPSRREREREPERESKHHRSRG